MGGVVSAFDAAWFRQVLGIFPTGVAVVTGCGHDHVPAGMAVGSFTSASLDPPLVAFFPDRRSSTWPRIQATGTFCVNILGVDQEALCRAFAARGGDKFAGVGWRPAPSGSPILDDVVAWLDCDVEAVHEAGDHWLVLGRVRALDSARPAPPLVFHQGVYGHFSPLPLAAHEPERTVRLHTAGVRTDLDGTDLDGTDLDDADLACSEACARARGRHAERTASTGEPVARPLRACAAVTPAVSPAPGGHPPRRT